MRKLIIAVFCFISVRAWAQSGKFDGLDMNMCNLSRLSDAQTRSISPENFIGGKGKGGMADAKKIKDSEVLQMRLRKQET